MLKTVLSLCAAATLVATPVAAAAAEFHLTFEAGAGEIVDIFGAKAWVEDGWTVYRYLPTTPGYGILVDPDVSDGSFKVGAGEWLSFARAPGGAIWSMTSLDLMASAPVGHYLVKTQTTEINSEATAGFAMFATDLLLVNGGMIRFISEEGFAVDNVRITSAAPEPATWALTIGGFALAGGALRRRRAATAA